jgi:hypothetical protein
MTNTKPSKVFINPKKRVAEKVNTYRAARTLKINGEKRWPGQLVPEASLWLRVGNFTHTGYLKEEQVPENEFDQAVQEYCPDLADRLAEKVKGVPVADKDDNKFTGFQIDENGRVRDTAAMRRLERERVLAETPPNERAAGDGTHGTPQQLEEDSAEDFHSDGGPTLFQEPEGDGFDDYLKRADKGEHEDPDAGVLPSAQRDKDDDEDEKTKSAENKHELPGRNAPAKKAAPRSAK